MTVKCLTPANRAEWLELRRDDLTASEIPCLLVEHPHCTPLDLYLAKTGHPTEYRQADDGLLEQGNELEPIALNRIRMHYSACNVLSNAGPRFYYRDTVARIGATPDCLVSDPERGLGVVEIKIREPSEFRKHWRPDGAGGPIEVPAYVALQTLTQAMLMPEVQWMAVAVLRTGYRTECDIVELPIDRVMWERLKSAVADFWPLIEARTPPPPNYTRDGRAIASLFPKDNGAELDLSHDNSFVTAVAERVRLKAECAELDKTIDALDAEIRFKAGAAQRVICGEWRVSLLTEHRRAYQVAASTRRPIRITSRKPSTGG